MVDDKFPKLKMVSVKALKPAPWNPPERKADKRLMDSMVSIGIINPVVIREDNVILEGHRRVDGARKLEWETILCRVLSNGQAERVYADVNASAKRLNGNQRLRVWLANPKAVTKEAVKKFERMEEVLGEALVSRIAKDGYSLNVYDQGARLAAYSGRKDDDALIKDTAKYLMKHGTGPLQEALSRKTEAATLIRAIRNDRPIRLVARVEE